MASADIVDLDDVVKRWAIKMFDITKTKDQARIPKESLHFDISWKGVRVSHGEAEFDYDTLQIPPPKSQILFRTFFTNNTDMEQEYSFKTERVTRSTCEVSVERGVTMEQELSLKLATPCEVFEANAGFRRELSVMKAYGETFEEELLWAVDSQIKVPSMVKTTAELVIKEDQYNGKFKVNSQLSGKIHVSITNLRDNNSFIKAIDGNLADIVETELHNGLSEGVRVVQNTVHYQTYGKCNFRYGVEQQVDLKQEKLALPDED